jgi:hypothetical protein
LAEIEFNCNWYKPCPLCSKCREAAPHIYHRCQLCVFGNNLCKHTEEQIATMIKRNNFVIALDEETKKNMKELVDETKSTEGRETRDS